MTKGRDLFPLDAGESVFMQEQSSHNAQHSSNSSSSDTRHPGYVKLLLV